MRMIPRAAFDDLNIDVPDLHTQRLIVETAELAGRERKLASEIADKRHQLVHAALVAAATHHAHSVERKTK
jgi:hypothetical protein